MKEYTMSTYMWQEERGVNIFRFQTDEKSVAEKMKRKKNFKQCGWGLNCPFWQFITSFYSPQKARKALGILTSRPAQKDSEEGVYKA